MCKNGLKWVEKSYIVDNYNLLQMSKNIKKPENAKNAKNAKEAENYKNPENAQNAETNWN